MTVTTSAATHAESASLNPRILGEAENAHAAILKRALAGTGVSTNGWIALTLTVTAGEPINRDQLSDRLAGALKTDADTARAVIADLTATDLLADDGHHLMASEAGQELFGTVRSAIAGVVARAYDGIPAEDLAVAARVLITITAALTHELTTA